MLRISLKAARINAQYKRKDVAKYLGKSPSTITQWEKGLTSVDASTFRKLCNLYNIKEEDVLLPN